MNNISPVVVKEPYQYIQTNTPLSIILLHNGMVIYLNIIISGVTNNSDEFLPPQHELLQM